MGFFEAISGRNTYFNETAVRVHNDIAARIRSLEDQGAVLFLAWSLDMIAMKVVDYFFNTKSGNLISVVKKYNITHFKELYKFLMVWTVAELTNTDKEGEIIRKAIQQIFDEKVNFSKWTHNPGEGREKLYGELGQILRINTSIPEGYLTFRTNYARIMKEAVQQLVRH